MRRSKYRAVRVWTCTSCHSTWDARPIKGTSKACPCCREKGLHCFPSKKEYGRWKELALLLKTGQLLSLELQPRFDLEVNGRHITRYVADFRYRYPSGLTVVEDSKGVETPDFKIKRSLFEALHGPLLVT